MPRDPAEADQAQDLAVELDPLVAAVVADGSAGPQRALGGLHVLGDEQHQRDGMLGRRDRRAVGRVADQDPAPGRRGDIDRVVADAGPGDDHQSRGAVHRRLAERRGPDDRGDGRAEAGEGVVARGRTEDRASGRHARGDLGEDRTLEPDRRQRRRRHVNPASGPPANRGSGSPLTPGSTAKRPPASGWLGSTCVGSAATDRGDEQGRETRAAERRHRRLRNRHADPPVDRPGRRDPEDHPAQDAGDPVAAGLVDGRPRPAGPATARSPGRPARWWPRRYRRRSRTPRRSPGGYRRSTSSARPARTRGRSPRRSPTAP